MTRGCTEAWEACPDRAHWVDLCKLEKGATVTFCDPWDIFPEGVVPAGTVCTVEENGLNEIYCTMLLKPVEPIAWLGKWNGLIHLSLPREGTLAENDEYFPAPVWIGEREATCKDANSN